MMSETKSHHYFVPGASSYSALLSVSVFTLALGFILQLNKVSAGPWVMLLGAAVILYNALGWFGSVVAENLANAYTKWEDKSFRLGMIWFIFSEVMFFAAFFGVLFYVRVISVPELAHFDPAYTPYPGFTDAWPSSGPKGPQFTPMGAWGIPAINTALLLTSGVTLTWAHWGLLKRNQGQLVWGLILTILLGVVFLCFQAYEYAHAYSELGLTLKAGVYGGTFYMLTGFHGFHVTLGAIMLTVIAVRAARGDFLPERHFAFEAVAWYWHFVDVVWLLLFVLVYWL